jgi:hypothetical protein
LEGLIHGISRRWKVSVDKLQNDLAQAPYILYISGMPSSSVHAPTPTSASYAALRYQGVPPPEAKAALELPEATAARFERLFLARPGAGPDPMRPRFARHALHVAAVTAQGGYPVLPKKCR